MMKTKRFNKWSMAGVNAVFAASLMVCALAPRDANAALKDALGDMFLSSGTEAQVINTQRLRGFAGGNISLRSPGRGFEIAQFARPKIDAGCGGIDIFFGSFSFINGAQFEQMIRSIAANATGYAIKMAISGMCDPCSNILDELEGAVRDLNALAKNTCSISMASFQETMGKLEERGRKIGEQLSISANRTADNAAATNKSQSEKKAETAKGGDAQTAQSNPVLGNLVMRAARETMGAGNNTLNSFMSEQQMTELVQSVFGTIIMEGVPEGADTCAPGTAAERCEVPPRELASTVQHWDKLLRPRIASPNGVAIWKCINYSDGCTKVRTGTMTLNEWGGVDDVVNLALFGTTTPTNPASYTSDSLIGAFMNKRPINDGGSNLSARARQMIGIIPMPIVLMLMELQKTPGAIQLLGQNLAQQLPKYFEYTLGLEILNIAGNTFTNQTEVDMPATYRAALERMTAQLSAMRPAANDTMTMVTHSYEMIKASQAMTNSTIRATSSSR